VALAEVPEIGGVAAWVRRVNAVMAGAELVALRRSVARGTAFGASEWVERTAVSLGLEASTRPRGRPKKAEK
jgi:putative transposase